MSVHIAAHCPGNCAQHPLTDSLIVRMRSGARWGDILYVPPTVEDEMRVEEYVREIVPTRESMKMKAYADMIERMAKQKKITKAMRPCKWLYLEEDGKTYSKHLTGAHCWAWEYVDPKTGKVEHPHTCKHLHPNEFGWRSEWD